MKFQKIISSTLTVAAASLLILLARIVFGTVPSTHPEANCFIMHYNSDAPLLNLIFDPLCTDWASFQARELSYLLDYFDAKFIFYSIQLRHAHFYSLTALILLMLSAILIHKKLKKLYPEGDAKIIFIIPLMYVTAFAEQTGFFRSAKPAVAFLLLWVFFTVAEMIKMPEKFNSFKTCIPMAIPLLSMPFFDRIGFFITAVCSAGAAVMLLFFACNYTFGMNKNADPFKKPFLIFSLTALTSVIISLIYNFALAPWIVQKLNHYPVSYEYQTFTTNPSALSDGALYIMENYGGFFFPIYRNAAFAAGLVICLFLAYAVINTAKSAPEKRITMFAFIGILTASIICTGMMISRHPMIKELPTGAYFLVFGTALTGIFAIIMLESENKKVRQLMMILVFTAILTPLVKLIYPAVIPPVNMPFHRDTTPYTMELLNDPEMQQTKILPTSSRELILFMRKQK
jgi:hypothetical protein